MFRTDLNHFLQSFDVPLIYKLMESISFMGTIYMLLLTILVLIGGINVRKGFLVLNVLGWSVLFMLGAKNYFDYPRPLAVDVTLNSFGRAQTTENLVELQPSTFFEGFSNELLVKIRSSDVGRYGLPSGHTMIITAVWLSIALLMRKKWLYIFSLSLILLTIISRMYLGMHYLGDVSLGLLLGLLFAFGFNYIYNRSGLKENITTNVVGSIFLALPIVLFFFSAVIPSFQGGALIGLNLGLLLILYMWGAPTLVGSYFKRGINALVFIILYFTMFFITKKLGMPKVGLLSMVAFSILNFATLVFSFYIGKLVSAFNFKTS